MKVYNMNKFQLESLNNKEDIDYIDFYKGEYLKYCSCGEILEEVNIKKYFYGNFKNFCKDADEFNEFIIFEEDGEIFAIYEVETSDRIFCENCLGKLKILKFKDSELKKKLMNIYKLFNFDDDFDKIVDIYYDTDISEHLGYCDSQKVFLNLKMNDETIIQVLIHELRHIWQYKNNLDIDYKSNMKLKDYMNHPMEQDARYAVECYKNKNYNLLVERSKFL